MFPKRNLVFLVFTHFAAILSLRVKELQSHLSLVEQFDQALLRFSQWSETMLSNLHSASQVNISNLQSATTRVKVGTAQSHRLSVCACRMLFCLELFRRFADEKHHTSEQLRILYPFPLTGDPGGLTEAVQRETELGAAD